MPRPQKKVDADKLLPEVVSAALGGKTFKQATRELSQEDADKLSRALGKTVEQFRQEFAEQLKLGAQEALDLLRLRLRELKAGELAFALSVLTDKSVAMDSRGATLNASVNQQVNNFYGLEKDQILALLSGKRPPTPTHSNAPISQETAPSSVIEAETTQPISESVESTA